MSENEKLAKQKVSYFWSAMNLDLATSSDLYLLMSYMTWSIPFPNYFFKTSASICQAKCQKSKSDFDEKKAFQEKERERKRQDNMKRKDIEKQGMGRAWKNKIKKKHAPSNKLSQL